MKRPPADALPARHVVLLKELARHLDYLRGEDAMPPDDIADAQANVDSVALDTIAKMLSSPEWEASFLEDIVEILTLTGRSTEERPDPFDPESPFQWPGH